MKKIHRGYLIKLRELKQVEQQMVAEYLGYITQYYQKLEYGFKGWSEKEMARVFELLSELYGISMETLYVAEREYQRDKVRLKNSKL